MRTRFMVDLVHTFGTPATHHLCGLRILSERNVL